MRTTLLSDLVDEFEESMKANGYAKNTIRNNARAARALLAHVGNIQARSVTPRHIDGWFAKRKSDGVGAGTLNVDLVALRALFRHGAQRRYIPAGSDPTAHRRPFKEVKRERLRIPSSDFGRLLDCTTHPRDRMIVALGLYLFLRQSEVIELRVGDVDLAAGLVTVRIQKTKQLDHMPISAELDAELRRWLTHYSERVNRPLRPDDFLVPAKTPPLFQPGMHPTANAERAKAQATLNPTRPVQRPEHAVQRALVAFGAALRAPDGRALSEGVHTLRRSGARALFDRLVDDGYDGAMETVQAMLHHTSTVTTEGYLGIHLNKKRRDDVVRGKSMFPVDLKNVVQMEAMRGNAKDIREAL